MLLFLGKVVVIFAIFSIPDGPVSNGITSWWPFLLYAVVFLGLIVFKAFA